MGMVTRERMTVERKNERVEGNDGRVGTKVCKKVTVDVRNI